MCNQKPIDACLNHARLFNFSQSGSVPLQSAVNLTYFPTVEAANEMFRHLTSGGKDRKDLIKLMMFIHSHDQEEQMTHEAVKLHSA